MHVIRSKVCCLIPFCLQFFSLFIFFLVGSSWSVAFSPEVLSTIAICSRKFPICTKFPIQSSQNQGRRTYNSTFWWQQLNFCINFGSFRWPIQLKSIHREEQEQNKTTKIHGTRKRIVYANFVKWFLVCGGISLVVGFVCISGIAQKTWLLSQQRHTRTIWKTKQQIHIALLCLSAQLLTSIKCIRDWSSVQGIWLSELNCIGHGQSISIRVCTCKTIELATTTTIENLREITDIYIYI